VLRQNFVSRVVDRFLARSINALRLSQAGFVERAGQKILLPRQLPNLRMQQFQIDHMRGFNGCSASAENPSSTFLQLRFPGDNLAKIYLEQLGQFGQCRLAFALRPGLCVRRVRFVMLAPDMRQHRPCQAGEPVIDLSEFPEPLLPRVLALAIPCCASAAWRLPSPYRSGRIIRRTPYNVSVPPAPCHRLEVILG